MPFKNTLDSIGVKVDQNPKSNILDQIVGEFHTLEKEERVDSEIDLIKEPPVPSPPLVSLFSSSEWEELAKWAQENEHFEEWERGLLYTLGERKELGFEMAETEIKEASRIYKQAENLAFNFTSNNPKKEASKKESGKRRNDKEPLGYVEKISSKEWFSLLNWSKKSQYFENWEQGVIYSIADQLQNEIPITLQQALQAARLHSYAIEKGFKYEEE